MRTNRKRLIAIATLGFLLLGPVPRPASASTPPDLPGSGPTAGPIEVSTMAEVISSPLGLLLETTVIVQNHGTDPATVLLLGDIHWPDGSRQRLRYGPPSTIDADGALIISALSIVPDSVGSGPGSFTAAALVGSVGMGGRSGYRSPLIALHSSSFELP